jgi:hypothetical protein
MPSARLSTAVEVNSGLRASARNANRKSEARPVIAGYTGEGGNGSRKICSKLAGAIQEQQQRLETIETKLIKKALGARCMLDRAGDTERKSRNLSPYGWRHGSPITA